MSAITRAFGKRMRQLRRERGLAQDRLAAQAGLSASYVGFIERGERNPTLETIYKLARVLGVAPKELLDFKLRRR